MLGVLPAEDAARVDRGVDGEDILDKREEKLADEKSYEEKRAILGWI